MPSNIKPHSISSPIKPISKITQTRIDVTIPNQRTIRPIITSLTHFLGVSWSSTAAVTRRMAGKRENTASRPLFDAITLTKIILSSGTPLSLITWIAIHADPPVASIGSSIKTAVASQSIVSPVSPKAMSRRHTLGFNVHRKLRVQKRGEARLLVSLD